MSSLRSVARTHFFISFARPKEMKQRKGRPQIFFGFSIFSAVHATQLATRHGAWLKQCCLDHRSPLSLKNVKLSTKKIWWHFEE